MKGRKESKIEGSTERKYREKQFRKVGSKKEGSERREKVTRKGIERSCFFWEDLKGKEDIE